MAHPERRDATETAIHVGIFLLGLLALATSWPDDKRSRGMAFWGAVAVCAAGLVLCCGARLRDPSSCGRACCLSPDCAAFSNAWHFRNLFIWLTAVFSLLGVYMLINGAVRYRVPEVCVYRCIMTEWKCGKCVSAWKVSMDTSKHPCCAWGKAERDKDRPGYNSSSALRTRLGTMPKEAAYCSQAQPMIECTTKQEADLGIKCLDMCNCVQAVQNKPLSYKPAGCYNERKVGVAYMVGGAACAGVAALSLLAVLRFNALRLGDGPLAAMPPSPAGEPPARGSSLVVGQPVLVEPGAAVSHGLAMQPGGGEAAGSSGAAKSVS